MTDRVGLGELQRISIAGAILVSVWVCAFASADQKSPAPVPESKIAGLEAKLSDKDPRTSAARRRLAIRRVIREGDSLLKTYPKAPNRFQVLGILFRCRRELLSLDKTASNREALLETCRRLAGAPDEYAAIRLDADLLLSQTELARRGADLKARGDALPALVERYRDTEVETKVLRIVMIMALEFGDTGLVNHIRQTIAERFPGDLELVNFLRDKLAGQVFGAPFIGTFTRADGKVVRFPMDGLGRTIALYFWSKEGDGEEDLKQLAAAWKEKKDDLPGRLESVSFNLDDLPDAGEKILRMLGVDWPAIRLPGGRNNPIYRAYVRRDPKIVTVSPTGYAAMSMAGTGTRSARPRDYSRWLNSSLARRWTKPRYSNQLQSLFAGEFLILDPLHPFDPAFPPELKAVTTSDSNDIGALTRTKSSLPAEKLRAIQECFVAPPLRYRMPREQVRANYEKADSLCRKAIAEHPQAPDLWMVRNRRMIALLGLWKLDSDQDYLERAVGEAKRAVAKETPPGADVVARFCLAREAFRAGTDPKAVIADFIEAAGGQQAPGSALAAAAILALDVGERPLHERYRRAILEKHIENPMMWTANSFLLDRFHRYWLFRAPYVAGWSFGRRESHFLSWGKPDDAHRVLHAELKTLDGNAFRIPEDTSGKWTAIAFMSRPHQGIPRGTIEFAEARPFKDVNIVAAILDDDAEGIHALLKEKPHNCPTVVVPGGIRNPLVHRLGILAEDERTNFAILRPDGSIAVCLSGLAQTKGNVIQNVVEWHDEKVVDDALKRGDLEKAKRLTFSLAPLEEPVPPDKKKRAKKPKPISLPHLRSRAKVYMAMKDWKAALADAQEVFSRLTRRDGSMSMRTAELDAAEKLKDTILSALAQLESGK